MQATKFGVKFKEIIINYKWVYPYKVMNNFIKIKIRNQSIKLINLKYKKKEILLSRNLKKKRINLRMFKNKKKLLKMIHFQILILILENKNNK